MKKETWTVKEIIKLKREHEEMKSVLRVIYTWATFHNGIELIPRHVEHICKKVLKMKGKKDE